MTLSPQQEVHRKLMQAICETISQEDKPLVLKGGTALLLGYSLDRFSEDLDFDLTADLRGHVNMESICKAAIKRLSRTGVQVSIDQFKDLKKTDTTHRCRVMFKHDEDSPPLPLKIEISSRSTPNPVTLRNINGIKVYSVDEIARLKLLAAQEIQERPYRTAARDLHDLAFIASEWEDELTDEVIEELVDFFYDPAHLMERYADAYSDDALLQGRLFTDLGVIEQWNEQHQGNSPGPFGPS